MPIGTGIVYNTGDLILSQVSSSGTAFLETKIAAATSSIIYFDSTARINSASLNSITVGTASYVSGSNSIITNLTASNISASGTGSFGYVGIGTNSPTYKLNVVTTAVSGRQTLTAIDKTSQNFVTFTNPEYSTVSSMGLLLRVFPQSDARQGAGIIASGGSFNGDTDLDLFVSSGSLDSTTFSAVKINARGNVGIGTTSPSAKLTIVDNTNGGTINLVGRTSDDTAAINFRATGDGSTYAYVAPDTNEFRLYHNDGFMSFYPGGSEKVRITSTGNVGIGTTIPSVRLHVSGSSILANNISIDPDAYSNTIIAGAISDRVGWGLSSAIGGNAGTGHSWAVGTNGGYLYMGYGNGSSNDSLQEFLMVSGSRNLYLVPVSGNIGVGTFSVYQKLTINGAIETGANGSTTGGPSFYIKYDGASGNYINSIGTEYSSGNTILGYGITGKSSSAGYVSTFANFSGHRGLLMIGAGTLEFKNSRTSLATAVGSDVPMTSSFYIDNSGNVGIGTTTPSAKLNIASTSQTTKAIIQSVSAATGLGGYLAFNPGGDSTYSKVAIGVYDNYYSSYNRGNIAFMINSVADTTEVGFTDTKMYISASGDVGIGTTTPTTQANYRFLQVNGTNSAVIETMVGGTRIGGFDSSATALYVGSIGSYPVVFRTAVDEKMRITAAGSVGIGTSSPAQKLEVQSGSILIRGDGTALFGTYYASAGENTFFTLHSGSGNTFHIGNDVSGTNYNTMVFTAATDTTGGKVGIGTTVPVAKLQVAGNISGSSFTSSISNAVGFLGTSSWASNVLSASFATTAQTANALNASNTYTVAGLTSAYVDVTGAGTIPTTGIYRPSTKTLGLSADGTLIFKISNVSSPATSSIETGNFVVQSGNVGIGTNSPNNRLDIFGGTGTTFNMGNDSDSGRGGKLTFISSSATGRQFYVGTNSSIYNLVFGIDSIEKMRLDTSGYFAINTTNTTPYSSLFPGQLVVDAGTSNVDGIFSSTNNTNAAELILTKKNPTNNFGSLLIQHSGSSGDAIALNYNVNTSTGVGGTNSFKVTTDGTGYFRGNVGIGTTGPSYKLDVSGSAIRSFTSAGAAEPGFIVDYPSSNGYGAFFIHVNGTRRWRIGSVGDLNAEPALNFHQEGTGSRMYIGSNGYVGIGTSVPAGDLDVYSSAGSSHYFRSSVSAIRLLAYGDGTNWIQSGTSTSNSSADLIFSSMNGVNQWVRIQSSTGNVGIGTSSPGAKLDVNGDVYISPNTAGKNTFILSTNASNDARLLMKSDTTTKVDIQANGTSYFNGGNVGIGTTTINYRLEVYNSGAENVAKFRGTNDTTIIIGGSDSGGSGEQYITYQNITTATNAWMVGMDDGEDFRFAYGAAGEITDGNTLVKIDQNGNVGIGTTSPAAKLEISGSSNSALLNIKSPISGAILYVSGSGAVGIGDSNVGTYRLYVSGSFGATTKSFIIDHPTKAGKKLIYGSLESPYHGIRLTGRDTLVNGKCKVELPDYMYKLILHDSINIQLTGIKCNKTLYVDEINIPENYFTIAYDKAIFESYKDYDFFWDFTAIRADVPELNTEL